MSTWFTVIGRIAQIEGMSNTSYKNALVEFEEGDSDYSTCRCFYVAFWGDILQSGRNYVIFGTGRLTGNEDCSQPKVRFLISPYDNDAPFSIFTIFTYRALWNLDLIGCLVHRHSCHPVCFRHFAHPLRAYPRSCGR